MQTHLVGSGVHLEAEKVTSRKFVISKEGPAGGRMVMLWSVTVECTEATITAQASPSGVLLVAKPSFDWDGACLLEVDGMPLQLWQVSRRILEDLFFSKD